jgi:hypothetical protein
MLKVQRSDVADTCLEAFYVRHATEGVDRRRSRLDASFVGLKAMFFEKRMAASGIGDSNRP